MKARSLSAGASKPDYQRLVHELEVHQTELESQNEELRVARREVELALASYTELYDFAPIGYATIDADNVIRNVNLAGAHLLGQPRGSLIGTHFSRLITSDDATVCGALFATARANDESGACEVRRVVSDTAGPVALSVTVRPQPREPRCLLLAFQDITRRKAEHAQLLETERMLREANHSKDEFLAMLSHELRNPLAPILTSLFVLDKSESGSADAVEAREIIERQVTHLTRLVDDLLDVTRISRGKVRLQRERVDLVDLVERTVEDHRPGFDGSRISLGVTCVPGPVWIDADPARIVQAVSNLLGNAQKFTPPGGRVAVTLQHRSGMAELRVRDTGTGIAPDLLPHVFEPFTQAPQSIDRSRGGLGLGLAMVKGFIELHGGTVGIASPGLGRGVEIIVLLPEAGVGTVKTAPAIPKLPSRRILVIEDHPDAARVLDTALKLLGLDVRVASDGRTGLDVARVFRPEVVLCDIGLPGMDGLEVARAFRRDRELRDTYLVALSGYAQEEDVERATAAGFSRHLAKPVTIDALVRLIAAAP